jgi:hypothetical protein
MAHISALNTPDTTLSGPERGCSEDRGEDSSLERVEVINIH